MSVNTDYNDDFCLFRFFVLVRLFFLYFFSSLWQSCFSLTLFFKKSPLFAKEDTKEEPKEIKIGNFPLRGKAMT